MRLEIKVSAYARYGRGGEPQRAGEGSQRRIRGCIPWTRRGCSRRFPRYGNAESTSPKALPMLIVMRHDASAAEVQRVVEVINEMGYEARPMPGKQRTAVGLVGND